MKSILAAIILAFLATACRLPGIDQYENKPVKHQSPKEASK